ncbi:MAG: hypothetical protein QXY33_05460 [Candidatus Nitrosocaldaceae archaeon]
MITVAHMDFYSYVYRNRLMANVESVDGSLYVEKLNGNKHVMIKREANKHELYAWRYTQWYKFWDRGDNKDEIGICYYPSTNAVMPAENSIRSLRILGMVTYC